MVWARKKADDAGLFSWCPPVCPGPGLTYRPEHSMSSLLPVPSQITQLSPYLLRYLTFK